MTKSGTSSCTKVVVAVAVPGAAVVGPVIGQTAGGLGFDQ